MNLILVLAFVLLMVAILLIFRLSPQIVLDAINSIQKKPSSLPIAQQVALAKKPKIKRKLEKLIDEVRHIMIITGKATKFATVCAFSIAFFIAGCLIAIVMNNIFLVPVLAVGFALLPFFYVQLSSARFRQEINLNLETALSAITTSYMRGNNSILRAIEENMPYLNAPVSNVFGAFVSQTRMISSDIASALETMKLGIDNNIFREWVDAIIACQLDNNLKSTLPSIVSKLSDVRVVSSELNVILSEPLRAYYILTAATALSPLLLYMLNKDWWITLSCTQFGKMLLAISAATIFLSFALMVKYTKPIEYEV